MLPQRLFLGFYGRAKTRILASVLLCSLIITQWPGNVWAQIVSATGRDTVSVVALLVEDALYENRTMQPLILRYANDVSRAQKAQVVITQLAKETSPFEIYEGLAGLYFDGLPGETMPAELEGVVLVGDLPLPVVEKGGNLWPTVFPYTDFYDPAYLWDENSGRFKYEVGGNLQPEIWHGLVRSGNTTLNGQVSDLKNWFNANHKLHRGETTFGKQVFIADIARQRKVVPSMLYWRYQEWIEFAEEIQYLRHTKHLLRRIYERAEQGGISSGNLNSLSEAEKQSLADEILEADSGLTRAEVLETLNADNLTELPDNFAKMIIDNLAKRYAAIYENWLGQINSRVERSGRWQASEVETLPTLVSQKDEASVLQLRYFNDELEKALLAAVNEANVPHDVAMPHTVPVPYIERGRGDEPDERKITYKPTYWNGVRPSESMTAEDCTLIRGANRNTERPFAQQVEANQSMDVDTVDLCKNASEPGFNNDKYEGCCARNITYENNEFGYNTCDLGTQWLGGQNGLNSLYHKGAELPVFSYRGTREIDGLEGSDGCRAGFATNESSQYAARFSSLMLHDEPRPKTLMDQVSAQFTRALPIDDPRGFSFLDHAERFNRVAFPNIFDLREAVASPNELEISVRNILQNKIDEINTITIAGNAASDTAYNTGAGGVSASGTWFPGYGQGGNNNGSNSGNNGGGGSDDECRITQSVNTIDEHTKERRWQGCGGSFTRFYETGDEISDTALEDFIARFDWEELYEALEWLDLNIEAKNLRALQKAMSASSDYNQFYAETDFNGYEVVQILAEGSSEKGMEMAFLPEDFDPDFEFLEARGEEAAFVYETGDTEEEFLGEDFADTFLNAEEESKCERIPNTTLTWPLRLACSLKATTTATTKNVSVGPNLGTNAPIEPIVEDLSVSLEDKKLLVTPTDIFSSSQSRDLIEVNIELQDRAENLVKNDFSTEITLEFDSRDAEQFFTISPSQSLPLTAGKATFYLVPKGREVGGKFNLQAVGRNVNNQGRKLSSTKVPVRLGTYRIWGKPSVKDVVVGDEVGRTIKVKVLDEDGAPSRDWEEHELTFSSDGGEFANFGKTTIKNGLAELVFLPGTKTGTYEIEVSDEENKLPPFKTEITLLPDLAVAIKLRKKSPYLIAGSFYQNIEAHLVDKFDNLVEGVPHQWTWDTDNLEIRDVAAYDADPRARGVQMLERFGQMAALPVRAQSGEETAQIGVKSDFLTDDVARGLKFTVIEDPVFEVTLDQNKIAAGSEDFITASIKAKTQEGIVINDDFTLQVGAEPLVQGNLPKSVKMKDGKAELKFQPGTLAGNFKLRLAHPGFTESLTSFTVEPGDPAKVDLSLPNQDLEAVNFDADKPIELEVQVFDKYRNQVRNWAGKMNLRTTDGTSHLIDINTSELEFLTGKQSLQIFPKNLAGTVRLLAEANDLTLGTLEFKLTSFFDTTDVKDLAPQSLMTLLLGWEAGDLRVEDNFANAWLLENRNGGVVTLSNDPKPAYQYGYLAPDGTMGPRLETQWVSAEHFNALIKGDLKNLAQAKRYRALDFKVADSQSSKDAPGLWWQGGNSSAAQDFEISIEDGLGRYQGLSVLQLGTAGGLKLLDNNFRLESTNNIYQWELHRGRDYLGDFFWQFETEELEMRELFTQSDRLEVKLIDPKVFTRESLVGGSTNDAKGYVLLDQVRKELKSRQLGSLGLSIEDESGGNHLAWSPDWGIAAHLAAGETIGSAVALGASDQLVLYGDPTLKTSGNNTTSNKTSFTQDIGQPIFKSPEGNIKNLFSIDIDGDGLRDVLSLTGNKLWVNRQHQSAADGRLRFGQAQQYLQVPGGIKSAVLLKNDTETEWQILQLDFNDQLTAWRWQDGRFDPYPVTWNGASPIESFQAARLDDDGQTDLVIVDEDHTLWRWSWLGDDNWSDVSRIYDFPPNFIFTDESLDDPGLNLKLGFVTYDGIEADNVLAGRTTITKTNPEAREQTLNVDNLDDALLGGYFDETRSNPNLINLVALEDASFLSRADYTTDTDLEQIKPGDTIEVELKLRPTQTLDRVQVLLPRDQYFAFVEGSFACQNCGGDTTFLPNSQRELLWVEIPRLQRGQTATLSWDLKVTDLPDMKVSVGDWEDGFDNLDDIAVAWSAGEDKLMLYFMSSKDESENPVTRPINDENEVVEVPDEVIDDAFDPTADPDGDGIPDSHDHYPDTENGSDSIGAGLLPGMLAGAIGGIVAATLQGGGSCFHQPMSVAQGAPGLSTSYNPPHATPGGKSGGRCATCLRNLRTYPGATSTGKGFNAVCLGRKRPNMASPAETNNCHVSAASEQFNETCPESGTNPQFSRLLNNSAGFSQGSFNFQVPGNIDAASLNSKLQTQSGDLPGRLTAGTDRASAWSSEQFVDLNRKTAESGPGSQEKAPQAAFAGESGANHLRPEGPLEETQKALEAGDTVNFTREPLPVMIPSTSASELEKAEKDFEENKETFETNLEAVIPAETESFQLDLENLVENLPSLFDQRLEDLPAGETLTPLFESYEAQLRTFAAQYKSVCLEQPDNQTTLGCQVAKSNMTQAQTDFNKLRTLQAGGLDSLTQAQVVAQEALETINQEAPNWLPALEDYTESLTSAVEARTVLETFVQSAEENFSNVKELITSATDRVLEIRELENQVMSATTAMTEIYAQQQQAFESKQAQMAQQWAATSAINQAQHSAEQGVMNQFYNFSLTYQTDQVDRGSLLPWITNNGIKGSMPITKPPVFPHVEQNGVNNTPGRLDVTLPQVQVEPVDIGPLPVLNQQPDMPEVSSELALDIENLNLETDPLEEFETLRKATTAWQNLETVLSQASLFPVLQNDATITGTFTALPEVPADVSTQALTTLASLDVTTIPAPLEVVETPEVPEQNTIPALVQPPLDFEAHLPSLPINQKPFTPPPPQTENKVGDLLAAAQPAFARMGQVGAYRIGASPVSEWHVKPHVERRTGRTSLDGNRDFTANSVEFKPYAELAQNLSINSSSGVTSMFEGLGESWQNFSEGLNRSLSFPNNENLPEVETAVPSEEIRSASLNPINQWKALQQVAFQYRGQMPALKNWENQVLSWDVETAVDKTHLTKLADSWNHYLAHLQNHRTVLTQQNRELARLADTNKVAFWNNPQVLALVPELGLQFTADQTPDLNFSVPTRSLKTSTLSFDAPDESTFNFDYHNPPNFNLPGNTLEDLQSQGIVNGQGDGGYSDEEKENLKNAGLKPGMYYAKNETIGVDLLHKMPFYGLEAQVASDLNNDGENEMLYTLRQRTVYVKQSPSTQPESITNFRAKLWPTEDFLAVRLPLKRFDTTPFWTQATLDTQPYQTELNTLFEWELRDSFEAQPNITHAAIAQFEAAPEIVSQTLAQVTDVNGAVEVAHLSRLDFLVRTKEACLALSPNQIYFDDVLIRAGTTPAKVWSYLHPLRGRAAKETEWTLNPGQELRLQYADICLLEGEATWQQEDEEAFMARREAQVGETLTDGSVLTLGDSSNVELQFADGQTRTITGPHRYYLNRSEPGVTPEFSHVVPLNNFITYNKLRTWKGNQSSVGIPLPLHPTILPWQN